MTVLIILTHSCVSWWSIMLHLVVGVDLHLLLNSPPGVHPLDDSFYRELNILISQVLALDPTISCASWLCCRRILSSAKPREELSTFCFTLVCQSSSVQPDISSRLPSKLGEVLLYMSRLSIRRWITILSALLRSSSETFPMLFLSEHFRVNRTFTRFHVVVSSMKWLTSEISQAWDLVFLHEHLCHH